MARVLHLPRRRRTMTSSKTNPQAATTNTPVTTDMNRMTALVTGGSRGLGRALGEALAAAGARVVLVAREAGPLEQAAAAIRARGGEAHGVAADVGDLDAAFAIAGQAAALV